MCISFSTDQIEHESIRYDFIFNVFIEQFVMNIQGWIGNELNAITFSNVVFISIKWVTVSAYFHFDRVST